MTKTEIEMIIDRGIEKYFKAKEAYEEKKRKELQIEQEKQEKIEEEREKKIFRRKLVLYIVVVSAISYIASRVYIIFQQIFSLL